MIDARDQFPSAPATNRPRSATGTGGRSRLGKSNQSKAKSKSVSVERVFSDAKVKPFDQIEWDKRTAEITDDGGKVIFKQENVEVPKSWSQLATKVVVSKYLRRATHQRTRNVRPPIDSSRLPHDCRLGYSRRLF